MMQDPESGRPSESSATEIPGVGDLQSSKQKILLISASSPPEADENRNDVRS